MKKNNAFRSAAKDKKIALISTIGIVALMTVAIFAKFCLKLHPEERNSEMMVEFTEMKMELAASTEEKEVTEEPEKLPEVSKEVVTTKKVEAKPIKKIKTPKPVEKINPPAPKAKPSPQFSEAQAKDNKTGKDLKGLAPISNDGASTAMLATRKCINNCGCGLMIEEWNLITSFGTAEIAITVNPEGKVIAAKASDIMDYAPNMNFTNAQLELAERCLLERRYEPASHGKNAMAKIKFKFSQR